MHIKDFKLQKPLDNYVVNLENFLQNISRDGLKSVSGSYTGDGTTSKTVLIGLVPILLIISKNVNTGTTTFPLAGNMAFSLFSNLGVSYIPGTGFVNDAVTGFSNGSITLGANSNVNAAGTSYLFLAIG